MEKPASKSRYGNAGLGFFLREAHRAYTRELERGFSKHRITPLQFTLLWILTVDEKLSQVELAQRAGITKASATGDVDALKARKLIQGRIDAHDKRKIILSLTEAGTQMVEKLIEHAATTNTLARGGLPKRTYRELIEKLREVTINLNEAAKKVEADAQRELAS